VILFLIVKENQLLGRKKTYAEGGGGLRKKNSDTGLSLTLGN